MRIRRDWPRSFTLFYKSQTTLFSHPRLLCQRTLCHTITGLFFCFLTGVLITLWCYVTPWFIKFVRFFSAILMSRVDGFSLFVWLVGHSILWCVLIHSFCCAGCHITYCYLLREKMTDILFTNIFPLHWIWIATASWSIWNEEKSGVLRGRRK